MALMGPTGLHGAHGPAYRGLILPVDSRVGQRVSASHTSTLDTNSFFVCSGKQSYVLDTSLMSGTPDHPLKGFLL